MKPSKAPVTVFLLAAIPAMADISYSQKISVEASGGMSTFSSEGETVTQLSGDRTRTDSQIKMQSRLASMAMGSGNTGTIVRLDKALTWSLNPDKKQYSEVTFAQAREQLQESMAAMETSGGGAALPVSEEGCTWGEADLEVEKPGDREKIAGIKSYKHVIRLRQSCTDPDTGKTCDMTWVMESWLAKKVPAEDEVLEFQRKYSKAMGLGDAAHQVRGPAQALVGMFGENWEALVDEVEDIKGYPLRTVMQLGMGGEQCTTSSGNPIAMDDLWADASTSAYNAALDQAGYEAGSAVGRAAGESLGGSVAGNIGGAAIGAAAGELIGGLGGMFKKKKPSQEKQEQANSAKVSDGNRQVTLFRITTEVTKWSEISIPEERFEEPVGWKKL